MKKKSSRKSFSLDEQILEDQRKEDLFQKLLSSSNLLPQDLPPIKYDLEEDIPKKQQTPKMFVEFQSPIMIENNLELVKENLHSIIEEELHYSKIFNWVSLIINFSKIIAYINLLLHDGCSGQNSSWFLFMFLHDIFQIVVVLKQIHSMPSTHNQQPKFRTTQVNRESQYPMAGRNSYYGSLMKEIDQWESQITITPKETNKQNIQYNKLEQYNQIFYVFLIIWGIMQMPYLCQTSILLYTFETFILLGTITLILRIIYNISYKCCFNQVMINYLLFAPNHRSHHEVIQSLPIYTKKTNESSLCYICTLPIKYLDSIINLPCKEMHQFHTKCITKWLNAHLLCPVCGEQIDLMNYQMQILS